MTKDKGETPRKPPGIEQALRDHKASKKAAAEFAAGHADEAAAERDRQSELQSELAALSQSERRAVLDSAGLHRVSAAPIPLKPIRGGYMPEPSVQPARWHLWRLLPRVELWQAVCLSLNIEPAPHLEKDATGRRSNYSRLSGDYWDRMMVCQAQLSTNGPIRPQGPLYRGMLQSPLCAVTLADVAAFLGGAGFTLPDEMTTQAPRADVPAVAATTTPAGAADLAAPAWQDLARKEARRIRKEREGRGQFPNLVILGDEVAKHFQEKGIRGPNGHELGGAYIKRWALQGHGITKPTAILRSTAKHRGK